jgi:hypothetical protein
METTTESHQNEPRLDGTRIPNEDQWQTFEKPQPVMPLEIHERYGRVAVDFTQQDRQAR